MYKKIIGLAVLPFLLAGCADNINSDHYNTNCSIRKLQKNPEKWILILNF